MSSSLIHDEPPRLTTGMRAQRLLRLRDWSLGQQDYGLLLLGLTVLATVRSLFWDTIPIGANMMDFFTFTDGAYRVAQGQIPHVDFSSSLGSATYFVYLLASAFVDGAAQLILVDWVVWLLILPALLTLPASLSAGRKALTALVVFFALMLPFNVDFGVQCTFNYNVGYNRWGVSFLLLAFIRLLAPGRKSGPDIAVDIFILVFLLLLKVNFFIFAVGALGLRILLRAGDRAPGLAALLGFAIVLLLIEANSGMITAYLSALERAAKVNEGAVVGLIIEVVRKNLLVTAVAGLLILASLVLWSVGLFTRRFTVARVLSASRRPLFVGFVVSASIVAESQNLGGIGMISLLALALVPVRSVLPLVPRRNALGGRLIRFAGMACIGALGAFLVLPWGAQAAQSSVCMAKNAVVDRDYVSLAGIAPHVPGLVAHHRHIAERFDPATLERERYRRDWILHLEPRLYVLYLEEVSNAIDALKRRSSARFEKTRVIDFADPFPLLTGGTPAEGGYIAMHFLRTLSSENYIDGESYFEGVDRVLVPNCALFELNPQIVALYQPFLDRDFRGSRLTRCWSLYERRR